MMGDESDKKLKYKIPKTVSEWIWDVIGYTVFIASTIFLIIVWGKLPEEVPGHYNALGEVDRWGSKFELWTLPLIGIFTLIFLQFFERYPEMHNYPKRINELNRLPFYLASRKLINQIKNISIMLFAVITLESVVIAMEWGEGFGAWSLPLMIMSLFLSIVVHMVKRKQIQ